MKTQNAKHHHVLHHGIFCFLIGCSVIFLLSSSAYAENRRGNGFLSTDEALAQTLADFEKHKRKTVKVNNKISEKNKAIRKRIAFLKQQMNELRNDKATLLKEFRRVKDALRLESTLPSSKKKRMQQFEKRQSRLKNELREIEKKIQDRQEKQAFLQKTISNFKNEIVKLQQRQRPQKYRQKLRRKPRQKPRQKPRRSSLNHKYKKKQNDLQESQDLLRQRLKQVREDLRVETNTRKGLKTAFSGIRNREEDTIEQAREKISELEWYYEGMKKAFERFQRVHKLIVSQIGPRHRQMDQWKGSLEKEHRLLSERVAAARHSVKFHEDLKENIKKNASSSRGKRQYSDPQQDRLENEQQEIQKQFQDRQDERGFLKKKMMDLSNEISGLQQKVADKRISSSTLRRKYKKEKNDFMQAVRDSRTALKRKEEKDIFVEKQSVDPRERKFLLERQGLLKRRLRQVHKKLQAEIDIKQELKAASLARSYRHEGKIKQVKKEIDELEWYDKKLQDTLKGLAHTRQLIASQSVPHYRQMNELKGLLEKETLLLAENSDAVLHTAQLSKNLKGTIKKDIFLSREKRRSFDAQQVRLKEERQKMQKQFQDGQNERGFLEKKRMALNNEITGLQKEIGDRKISSPSRGRTYKKEKNDLTRAIKNSRAELRRKEEEGAFLEKQSVKLHKRKVLLERRGLLKQRLQVHQDLLSEIDIKQELKAASLASSYRREEKIDQVKKEIDELKLYDKVLKGVFEGFRYTRQFIASQSGPRYRQMNELKGFLEKENRLLAKNSDAVLHGAQLSKDLKENIERDTSLFWKKRRSFDARQSRLKEERKKMQKQSQDGHHEYSVRKNKIASLKVEIKELKLRKELQQAQEGLQAEMDTRRELMAAAQAMTHQKENRIQQVKNEIHELKLYDKGLKDALEGFAHTRQLIVSQSGPQYRQMNEFKGFLEKEILLLAKYSDAVLRSVKAGEDLKKEVEKKGSLTVLKASLNEQKKKLRMEQDNIKTRITDSREYQQTFGDEKRNIVRKIRQLDRELAVSGRKVHSARMRKGISIQKRISQQVQKYAQKIIKAQEKLFSLEKDKDQSNRELAQSWEEQYRLNWRLRAAKDESRSVSVNRPSGQRHLLYLEREQAPRRVQKIKEEIDALKTRSMVLSDSLSIIKSKYKITKKPGMNIVNREKKELKEYLLRLREENDRLRKEVLTEF